jgi:cellulose synthase/poly-beta-1,6-N-acetylglucosamine synthase-like glycosyltransferase
MKIPFVTVGIITKNEEINIRETISSILNSNYPKNKYEILIVDGNSKDKTQQIVEDLIKSNKNIRLLIEPWEKGTHGKARNYLADNAKGNYLAFTDGDCIVKKNWLRSLVETLIKEKVLDKKIVAVGGTRKPIKTNNWKENTLNNIMSTFFGCGGSSNFIGTKNKYVGTIPNYNAIYLTEIVRREKYSNLGVGEDYEFNLRLGKRGYKIIFSEKAVIYHHQEPSFSKFLNQMYNYGKAQVNIYREISKLRFFAIISPLFVLGLILGLMLSFLNLLILKIYLSTIAFYIFLDIFYSLKVVFNTKKNYNLILLIIYPLEHIFYGLGVLGGILNGFKKKN